MARRSWKGLSLWEEGWLWGLWGEPLQTRVLGAGGLHLGSGSVVSRRVRGSPGGSGSPWSPGGSGVSGRSRSSGTGQNLSPGWGS